MQSTLAILDGSQPDILIYFINYHHLNIQWKSTDAQVGAQEQGQIGAYVEVHWRLWGSNYNGWFLNVICVCWLQCLERIKISKNSAYNYVNFSNVRNFLDNFFNNNYIKFQMLVTIWIMFFNNNYTNFSTVGHFLSEIFSPKSEL